MKTQHLGIVTVIKFVSDDVSVELLHVPQHREIEFYVIPNGTENETYEMEEIIGLTDPRRSKNWRYREVITRFEIEEFVKNDLAEMLHSYGQKLLKGDSVEFQRLAEQRKVWLRQQGM